MGTNKEGQFSRLFLKNHTGYRSSVLLKSNVKLPEHPFYKIDFYISTKVERDIFWDFERDFKAFLTMKEVICSSFDQFQFEYSLLLHKKAEYLNEVVRNLLRYVEIIEGTIIDSIESDSISFSNESRLCLLQLINGTLKDIFMKYHLDLNNSHHSALSKWFHLKESIRSFQWTHYPENNRLWNLYKTYLVEPGFIGLSSFQTFKALFENKVLENKVIWYGSKSSLYLFIRLLIRKKVIRNTKNQHWIIASEYFLLGGETFTPEELRNQKETQNKEQRKALEYFVSHLIS